MTKANTMQARRKLRKRCPCQKLWVSTGGAGADVMPVTVALLASVGCSVSSISFGPTMFLAVELHISQVLQIKTYPC